MSNWALANSVKMQNIDHGGYQLSVPGQYIVASQSRTYHM